MPNRAIAILMYLSQVVCFAQSQKEYFEGVVTYSIKEVDGYGNPVEVPIDKQETYFTEHVILTKHISGMFLLVSAPVEICLNARENAKYLIDHPNRSIKKMQPPADVEVIVPIEEIKLSDEEIKGYQCDVTKIKYVHRYQGPYGEVSDTLTCTYYNSKTLKLSNAKAFAVLQGNRNTLLLDGRYSGLPLKVVYSKNDGAITRIEADMIKRVNVDEKVKLPDYEVSSN